MSHKYGSEFHQTYEAFITNNPTELYSLEELTGFKNKFRDSDHPLASFMAYQAVVERAYVADPLTRRKLNDISNAELKVHRGQLNTERNRMLPVFMAHTRLLMAISESHKRILRDVCVTQVANIAPDIIANSDFGQSRGRGAEMGLIAVIGTIPGCIAYPALERQGHNKWQEDKLKLSWDLTVESDGTSMEQGTYYVQSKWNNSDGGYHPSIHLLRGGALFNKIGGVQNIKSVFSNGAGVDQPGQDLRVMQEMCMERLSAKDPNTGKTLLLSKDRSGLHTNNSSSTFRD